MDNHQIEIFAKNRDVDVVQGLAEIRRSNEITGAAMQAFCKKNHKIPADSLARVMVGAT